MKVIHIIPSAFEYFDDIRARAFKTVSEQNSLGIAADAFTLQYGSVSRGEKAGINAAAPHQHYLGQSSFSQLVYRLADYDAVHLHTPFLGGAGALVKWKRAHPDIPLLASYYRPVKIVDGFSVFIWLYNRFYLPKIFALAQNVFDLTNDPKNVKIV